MKTLCVIGAGAAGLCAAKNGIEFGYDVTVFEQTDQMGGTWVYTDKVGKDKNGLDIHSSMYKGLFTNLPKEIMGYPNIPFAEQESSYIPSRDVLKYYQSYADSFDLRQFIKFEHHVVRVRPLPDESWELIVQNMTTKSYETFMFDIVLVCSGHYNTPKWPKFKGQESFGGKQLHSKDYRSGDQLRDENVLLVGAGPSGIDIAQEIAAKAKHFTWSHHLKNARPGIDQKPDIREITKTGVFFTDGTYQDCSVILYCTGYNYTFPFLSVDCGVKCEDNYVRPLFKHCLSINRPTMGLIGLPNFICPNQMCDLQVRFCLTFMSGRKQLPSKDEMISDMKKEMHERRDRGMNKNRAHYMGPGVQDEYYASLAATAEVEPIKPVIGKIFAKGLCNLLNCDPKKLRNEVFKIIDDEHFITSNKEN